MLELIGSALGAVIPAGLGLFITAMVAGRKALTPMRARISGLVGILVIAIVAAYLAQPLLALVGYVLWGLLLRHGKPNEKNANTMTKV